MTNPFVHFIDRLAEKTGEKELCESIKEGYRVICESLIDCDNQGEYRPMSASHGVIPLKDDEIVRMDDTHYAYLLDNSNWDCFLKILRRCRKEYVGGDWGAPELLEEFEQVSPDLFDALTKRYYPLVPIFFHSDPDEIQTLAKLYDENPKLHSSKSRDAAGAGSSHAVDDYTIADDTVKDDPVGPLHESLDFGKYDPETDTLTGDESDAAAEAALPKCIECGKPRYGIFQDNRPLGLCKECYTQHQDDLAKRYDGPNEAITPEEDAILSKLVEGRPEPVEDSEVTVIDDDEFKDDLVI